MRDGSLSIGYGVKERPIRWFNAFKKNVR